MANANHLKILKQGAQAWGLWRQKNPGIRPDLSKSELSGTDLAGVNFRHAKLNYANLDQSDLHGANFSGASLYYISLCGADLTKAKLTRASIQKADLIGAKLCGSDLRRADLRKADLFGADLSGSDLRGAYLVGASLSGAKITGARLFGTARDDWKIDGVVCDHIYWDQGGRKKTPIHGKFKIREFESIYKNLPGVSDHFDLNVNQNPALDSIILNKAPEKELSELTPSYLSKIVLPYLNAIAELQHFVNQFSEKPGCEIKIVSITQKRHIKVIMTGVTDLLSIIQKVIVPWRRKNRKKMEHQEQILAEAAIKNREAEILEIKSRTQKNQMESKMLNAEAAKKRAEANLIQNNTISHHHIINKEVEAQLVMLLQTAKISEKSLMEFKRRTSAYIDYLIRSNLAD